MFAFYRIRGDVKSFTEKAHLLEPLGIELEEWLGMPGDVRKLKLDFAKAAARQGA